ncbi:MAG: hypothetical protein WED34_06255 [Planctomycetales bacterium]
MSATAILALSLFADAGVVLDRPVPVHRTGRAFRDALAGRMNASWRNVPRRDVLRRVADNRRIALLLDRRIDPSRPVDLDAAQQTTAGVIAWIAREADAGTAVVGNTVYLGPPAQAALLENLVRQRGDELSRLANRPPLERRRDRLARRTVHWQDLDRPAEIVAQIAADFGLAVDGLDRLPHDLWAGWTLPDASAVEALSLVLIQFDLTFDWSANAAGIRIVPVPDDTPLELEYAVADAAALALRLRQEFPTLAVATRGNALAVKGSFAQVAAAMPLIAPARVASAADSPPANAVPLSRRQFTLRAEDVPASALMQKLGESGIAFEYDPEALAAAGIDLDARVRMNVEKADAEKLFRALFDPLGVRHTIDGTTVRLTPK